MGTASLDRISKSETLPSSPLPPFPPFYVTSRFLSFKSAKEISHPHNGPTSFLLFHKFWAEKAKIMLIFMTLNIKQFPKYGKTDLSQRFAYICCWSATFLKFQHYGIYQTNKTKGNLIPMQGILPTVCETGLRELAAPTQPAELC